MVSILYFGRFRDVAANEDMDLPPGIADSNGLIAYLTEKHSGFDAEWQRAGARMAINKTIVNDMETHAVNAGDEIAFMSALSGG